MKQTDIEKINTATLQKILDACERSFPTELNVDSFYGEGQTTWAIPEIGLIYKDTTSKIELLQFVENLTDTKNIRQAYENIYKEVESRKGLVNKDVPEQPNRTTVSEKTDEGIFKDLENQEKKNEKFNKGSKEAVAQLVKNLNEKKRKEEQEASTLKTAQNEAGDTRIQEEIKNKKVVVVPKEEIPTVELSDEDKKILQTFSEVAKEDPLTVEQFIEQRINESLTQTTSEYRENITPAVVKKIATSITENFISLPEYKSIGDIPTKVSTMHPASPLAALIMLNDARLKKLVTDDEARKRVAELAQSLVSGIQAESKVNSAGADAVFGENISSVFYGPANGHITQFEIAENQEEQRENGVEIDIRELYDKSKGFYKFYQKISRTETARETVSSAIIQIPTYVQAAETSFAAKTASDLARILPKALGDYGFRQGVLLSKWAKLNIPQLISGQTTRAITSIGIGETVALSNGLSSRILFSKNIGQFSLQVMQFAKNSTVLYTAGGTFGEKAFGLYLGQAGGKIGAGTVSAATGKLAFKASTMLTKAATFVAGLGSLASAGLSLLVGYLFDKIVKNWPKIKNWLRENGPALLGVGGLVFIGPAAGVGLFAGGVILTGGLAALATGVLGTLGFIGGMLGVAIATPAIVTLLIIPPLVAFIMLVINNSAYLVPPEPSTFQNIVSPYIDVVKTPVPPGPFQNSDLPLTVEYKITIRAKKSALTNVRIGYECSVTKDGPPDVCPAPIPVDSDSLNTTSTIPTTVDSISPTSTFSFSYKQEYPSGRFEDTLISDTITVTADVPEELGVKASGSAGVKIGNPPDTCPSIWPVDGQYQVFQTPGGYYSHKTIEAIDIGTPTGITIKATHSGKASVVYTTGAYRPLYVDITSICEGKSITTRYAHLSGAFVKDGDTVNLNQPIGASGSGGEGPHLHYEFIGGLKMVPPYIPKPIVRDCSGSHCGMLPI